MAWIVLIISGLFESVWAIALSRSGGFTRPVPTTIFAVALVVSLAKAGVLPGWLAARAGPSQPPTDAQPH